MYAAQGPASGVEGIGGSPRRRTTLLGRLTVFGKLQLKGCHEPSLAPPATQPAVNSEAAILDELAVEHVLSGFGQSGALSNRDEPSPVPSVTQSAVDPEAATDELSVEHVMSGFGLSGALNTRSAWRSSLTHLESESSTQSMARVRSRAQARFLKRVGRTETEDNQLEMDYSLSVHDEELLRAVPASAILGCSGRVVMSSNEGSEATFSLSRPVMCLHYFVSHSWQTPAWLKMVCLMYEMNACRAVVAAVATQIVMGGLQTAGLWNFDILPPAAFHIPNGQRIKVVQWEAHWVISCIVLLLVLRWGHAIPVRESFCFLDKCCIDQTDSIKKSAGISQLGAFLRNSEYLLVLWQPEYLTRLWCIYELAAFSYVNGGRCDRVLIRPLKVSVFTVGLAVSVSCATMIGFYVRPRIGFSSQRAEWIVLAMPGDGQQFLYLFFSTVGKLTVVSMLPLALLWTLAKWHMNDLRTLRQQLSEFRLADTECQVAEDRIFVLGQVTEWFGSADEFEKHVRSALHSQVEKLLQDQGGIPYGTALFIFLARLLMNSSGILTSLHHGDTECMWRFFFNFGINLCTYPCGAHLFALLAGSSIGGDIEGRSFFKRKLAGPLLLAAPISTIAVISDVMLFPSVPLWLGPILLVVAAAVATLCHKRDWWHRVSTCLPRLCAAFSSAGKRPGQAVSFGPTADGSRGSPDSRPTPPRELCEAR